MNGRNNFGILGVIASNLRNIRGRTWLILAAIALVLVGFLLWAGVTILLWLLGQAPTMTETGKRFASEAMTQVEQIAPEMREQAEQWLPGAKESINHWLPRGEVLPANDVSGSDIGPVPRFSGLVRNQFVREGQNIEVAYVGNGTFDAVLMHYLNGFAAADYAHEVVSASTTGEQHRFRQGQKTYDLSLLRHPGGLLELRLKLVKSR